MIEIGFTELSPRNRLTCGGFGLCWIFFVFSRSGDFSHFLIRLRIIGVSVWNKNRKILCLHGLFIWTIAWIMAWYSQSEGGEIHFRGLYYFIVSRDYFWSAISGLSRQKHPTLNDSNPIDVANFRNHEEYWFFSTLFAFHLSPLVDFQLKNNSQKAYKLGIQLGLVIFLIGRIWRGLSLGGQTKSHRGATEGQEGLFPFRAGKSYGDLRIFHFLGLHALQSTIAGRRGTFLENEPWKMFIFGFVYSWWVQDSFG